MCEGSHRTNSTHVILRLTDLILRKDFTMKTQRWASFAGSLLLSLLLQASGAHAAGGNVDILFIDDNSASMEVNESSLGSKFTSFIAAIKGLNWQIGITTTDCGDDEWAICGSLLTLNGLGNTYAGGNDILTDSMANY